MKIFTTLWNTGFIHPRRCKEWSFKDHDRLPDKLPYKANARMTTMYINPYDLLGVTTSTPLPDIKKAYYQLALCAHPDKGGTEEDMRTIQHAYEFVVREMRPAEERATTVERLEEEFQAFCSLQTKTLPMFQDIYAEAFDLPKFNEYFAQHAGTVWKAACDKGYGDLMDPTHPSTDYQATEDTPPHTLFPGALQVYQDPIEFPTPSAAFDYAAPTPDTFTTQHMYDYQEAHAPPPPEPPTDPRASRTLAQVEEEREATAYQDGKVHADLMWSHAGLVDHNGKRIRDFFRLQEKST